MFFYRRNEKYEARKRSVSRGRTRERRMDLYEGGYKKQRISPARKTLVERRSGGQDGNEDGLDISDLRDADIDGVGVG